MAKNRALYQLKITLRDIQPPVWRRIQVWEDATLAHLHTILQFAYRYDFGDSWEQWTDWVDYWAVDFDYMSRKEIIRAPVGSGLGPPKPGLGTHHSTTYL